MPFRKPRKELTYLKLLLSGPSGSGKTTTALRIARGMSEAGGGDTIGVIDTQNGQADLEADFFDFLVCPVHYIDHTKACEATVRGLKEAYEEKLKIVVLDTLSTPYEEVLVWKDHLEGKKQFTGWGHPLGTAWNRLIRAIMRYPGHVICTAKEKEKFHPGRGKEIVELGMQRILRPGTEYEFPLTFRLDHAHVLTPFEPPKTVFAQFADVKIEKPGEELGEEILTAIRSRGPREDENTDDRHERRHDDDPGPGADDEVPWGDHG